VSKFIQIRLADGSVLYTDWGANGPYRPTGLVDDAANNGWINNAERLREFRAYVAEWRTFTARKSFIDAAPKYEVMLNIEQIVSMSLIGSEWQDVLDEGQYAVYLYEDEIRALINASFVTQIEGYEPPALTISRASLEEALDSESSRLH